MAKYDYEFKKKVVREYIHGKNSGRIVRGNISTYIVRSVFLGLFGGICLIKKRVEL